MRTIADDKSGKVKSVQEFLDLRNQLKKQIGDHKQQETEILSQMNALKREHQALIAKQQKERQEEKRKREVQIEREALEIELNQIERSMVDSESRFIEQLINYVKSLMNEQPESKESEQKTEPVAEKATSEGEWVLYKKDDKNPYLDNCISGNANKSKKEDRKNRKNNVPVKTNQPFAHGILMLTDFAKIGIDPPFTTDDCSACIELLEQRLSDLKSREDSERENLEKQKNEILEKLKALKVE